jgi:hypothetical protein
MTTERLIKLHVPVPPMLEEALGYTGNGKFVAFYWGAGDEAYYDDGRSSATGEWDAYLAFVQHPTIEPALRPYHLGDSDSEATHELVLDREERKLYVGAARAVNRFLQRERSRKRKRCKACLTASMQRTGKRYKRPSTPMRSCARCKSINRWCKK